MGEHAVLRGALLPDRVGKAGKSSAANATGLPRLRSNVCNRAEGLETALAIPFWRDETTWLRYSRRWRAAPMHKRAQLLDEAVAPKPAAPAIELRAMIRSGGE